MHKKAIVVVAAIAPWNFPFEVAVNRIAPARATGNTVVLEPAPDTPLATRSPWIGGDCGRPPAAESTRSTPNSNSQQQPRTCCGCFTSQKITRGALIAY
ncbi:aldehyde dehydrogenase family protein [Rhodococcoides yunnanense]|uniref:Aldehyde dehydrogenase family protein n=1 Tax=Rhodococcoides yunnanense TaxID=278209 RepID=A0ABU4BLG9_9NOCA|nr:aldehyde dehydrogenase family protein [Rhodococcus yunnanensis]MDV6264923.1 aldehyde dehydrogenase family protein [Rhodococcus yunnanensis]